MQPKSIDFLIPRPIIGSGGHRTIFRHANNLSQKGFEVRFRVIYLPHERSENPKHLKKEVEEWFGFLMGDFANYEDSDDSSCYFQVATAWFTYFYLDTSKPCAYFVQDFENLFMPAGLESIQAAHTYSSEIPIITIGSAIAEVVKLYYKNSDNVYPTRFGVDARKYFVDQNSTWEKRSGVIFLYQPDKNRRCHKLVEQTAEVIKARRPEIKLISFGSDRTNRRFDLNLGLISEIELGEEYRKAKVGVALSATNPSRIPFEMVSSGLPTVELSTNLTRNEYEKLPISVSSPFPENLADAVIKLHDMDNFQYKSSFRDTDYASTNPIELELLDFEKSILSILGNSKKTNIKIPKLEIENNLANQGQLRKELSLWKYRIHKIKNIAQRYL